MTVRDSRRAPPRCTPPPRPPHPQARALALRLPLQLRPRSCGATVSQARPRTGQPPGAPRHARCGPFSRDLCPPGRASRSCLRCCLRHRSCCCCCCSWRPRAPRRPRPRTWPLCAGRCPAWRARAGGHADASPAPPPRESCPRGGCGGLGATRGGDSPPWGWPTEPRARPLVAVISRAALCDSRGRGVPVGSCRGPELRLGFCPTARFH